jgi:hypothetical protein
MPERGRSDRVKQMAERALNRALAPQGLVKSWHHGGGTMKPRPNTVHPAPPPRHGPEGIEGIRVRQSARFKRW